MDQLVAPSFTNAKLLALALSGISLGWFIVLGIRGRQLTGSLTAFFLGEQKTSEMGTVASLAATNSALALTVFWHSFLGYQYGIGAAFWLAVCWILGFEAYALFMRNRSDFPAPDQEGVPQTQTLHEYATARADGEWGRRALALTSIATFLLMVNVELTRGMNVFKVVLPPRLSSTTELLGLVVIGAVAVYSAVGGFRAVVKTDVVQWILCIVSVAICIIVVWGLADTGLARLTPLQVSSRKTDLFVFGEWPFIVGSLFSWGFWFLVTMDMWQRGAAARTRLLVTNRTRIIYYPWFIFLSTTSVLMGITVKNLEPDTFHPFPAIRFMEFAHDWLNAVPFVGPLAFALLFVGMVGAMISTLDTYIVVISHSLFRDLPSSETIRSTWGATRARRPLIMIATLSIALAGYPVFLQLTHLEFDINSLLYIATSLPFAVLPSVLFRPRSSLSVAASAIAGVAAAVIFVSWVVSGIHASYATPSVLSQWYNRMYFAPLVVALTALIGLLVATLAARNASEATNGR